MNTDEYRWIQMNTDEYSGTFKPSCSTLSAFFLGFLQHVHLFRCWWGRLPAKVPGGNSMPLPDTGGVYILEAVCTQGYWLNPSFFRGTNGNDDVGPAAKMVIKSATAWQIRGYDGWSVVSIYLYTSFMLPFSCVWDEWFQMSFILDGLKAPKLGASGSGVFNWRWDDGRRLFGFDLMECPIPSPGESALYLLKWLFAGIPSGK